MSCSRKQQAVENLRINNLSFKARYEYEKKAYEYRFRVFFIHLHIIHCLESACIRSFSGHYFPAFGLNTETYRVNLRTPNTGIFYAAIVTNLIDT